MDRWIRACRTRADNSRSLVYFFRPLRNIPDDALPLAIGVSATVHVLLGSAE